MDISTFLNSRVCIVSGKGGVGKTTVCAVLARAAAASGRKVLLVEIEGKNGLPKLFGGEDLSYEPTHLSQGIEARQLSADRALLEFLHQRNLHWFVSRLQSMNILEIIAAAAPGLKDIVLLGKIKQLEQQRIYDHIILDAPAVGHTLSFLGSPAGVIDAVRVGPIRTQAEQVQEMLADHERTSVVLVSLAEETPINETIETSATLAEKGIRLAGTVVNCWYPKGPEDIGAPPSRKEIRAATRTLGLEVSDEELAALAEAASFRSMRHRLQVEQLDRLTRSTSGALIPRLPFVFKAQIGPHDIENLADDFLSQLGESATVAP